MNKDSDNVYKSLEDESSNIPKSASKTSKKNDLELKDQAEDQEETKSHQSHTDEQKSSKVWIITGLGAGIMFAFSNFLMGEASHLGVKARVMSAMGNLTGILLFFFFSTIYSAYYKAPRIVTLKLFINFETKRLSYCSIAAVLFDSILSVFGGMTLFWSFQYALYADLNQGVITTIFAFTSILLAGSAYVFFGERLTSYHIVGMTFLGICIILVAFSGNVKEKNVLVVQGDIVERVTPLIPIGFSLITTIYFAARTLYLKQFSRMFNSMVPEFTAYSTLIS